MTQPIHVTEAESVVLAALWRHGLLTPVRLVEIVQTRREWGEATIKTLLGRLMQKKAVRSEREEGRLIYRPLLSRETYVAAEVDTLVASLFGGDRASLAAYLDHETIPPPL